MDQIANELMNRALASNADILFNLTSDLNGDMETEAILEDTDELLEIRRSKLLQEAKKKKQGKVRVSPRIKGRLRFLKSSPSVEMDNS
jgi:hypothetical protein